MKLFLVAALFTLAVFAGQCRAEEDLETQKNNYIAKVVLEASKNVAVDCFGKVKTGIVESLKATMDKYLVKFQNGEPIYKKEGKEYNLWRSIKHSKVVKQLEKDGLSCYKDVKKSVVNVVKKFFNNIQTVFKDALDKVKNMG